MTSDIVSHKDAAIEIQKKFGSISTLITWQRKCEERVWVCEYITPITNNTLPFYL